MTIGAIDLDTIVFLVVGFMAMRMLIKDYVVKQ